MGTVYRAVHEHLEQVRAVKVMSAHLAHHESFVRLFRREAMLAARLRHPNIVQIYDVAEQDNLHYIVMELLAGSSLRAIIRASSPIPFERAIHLLRQLAEALDFAHSQHVSHRDVKPANIFVDDEDRLTLVDFGIARAAEGTHLTITTGSGTPEYMAPEAIDEEILGENIDPFVLGVGTDRYALGVVAYELLAGRVPFSGRTPQAVAYAHVHRPPAPIRSRRPDLPESIEPVILRQLAKIPSERYDSAAAFVEALAEGGRDAVNPPTLIHDGTVPTRPADSRNISDGRNTPPSHGAVSGPRSGASPIPMAPFTPTPAQPSGGTPSGPSRQFPPPTPTGWVNGTGEVSSESPTHTPRPSAERAGARSLPPAPVPGTPAASGPARRGLLAAAGAVAVVLALLGLVMLRPWSASAPSSTATPAAATTTTGASAGLSGAGAAPSPISTTAGPSAATGASPVAAIPPTTVPPTAPAAPPPPAATATPSATDRVTLAEGMLNRGETGPAVETLLAAEAQDRSIPLLDELLYRAFFAHGRALLDGGDVDGSWAMYQRALDRRPGDGAALAGQRQVILLKHWRSMEAAWGKDDEAALAAAREVFALDPGYRDIRDKLYALLIAQADRQLTAGERDAAFTTLMAAMEIKPDAEDARMRLRSYTPTPLPTATPAPVRSQPAAQPQQSAPAAQPASQPAAQPAAQPASQPAAQPASQPASQPSTAPVTQPSSGGAVRR